MLVVSALLGCVALARASVAEPCPSMPFDEIAAAAVPRIESFSLENGLQVHLVPKLHDSSVAVRVAYDVGARDEAPGQGGVAHLFEHMMFKGSENVPDGGLFRLARDVGGRVGAATDYDTTEYWDTVPRAALEQLLFAEADRMRGPRISEANLTNQRAAIQEEGLSLANLPYASAALEFGLALWEGTPYGHSPLGTQDELEQLDAIEAAAFHATHYSPSNAVLVIVGGFELGRTRQIIETLFGGIPKGPVRAERAPIELSGRVLREVLDDPFAAFPVYSVVWHGVGATHPDAAAISLLDHLLLGHPDAGFSKALRDHWVLDAYSMSFAFRSVGLLNYVFAPRTYASFGEIQAAIQPEIERLREQGPSELELCRSRRQKQVELLEPLETNEGIAMTIAKGALIHENPRHFEAALLALTQADPASVQTAARRYLVDDYMTLEIRAQGLMRWLKPVLEFLPSSAGASLEEMLF